MDQLTVLGRGVSIVSLIKWCKTMTTPDVGKDVGELHYSYVAYRNVQWNNHSGIQFGSFFRN